MGSSRGACLVRPYVRPSGRPSVKILITKKRFAGPQILKIEYGFRYAKNGTGAIPSQTHVFVSRKTTVPSASLRTAQPTQRKNERQGPEFAAKGLCSTNFPSSAAIINLTVPSISCVFGKHPNGKRPFWRANCRARFGFCIFLFCKVTEARSFPDLQKHVFARAWRPYRFLHDENHIRFSRFVVQQNAFSYLVF